MRKKGDAGGEKPSGLHRAIGPLSIRPSPPWQVGPNAAALWWSGQPLRGIVKDRFSFCLELLPALLGLGEVLPGVLTRLPRVVGRGGTRARARRGHIEAILLIAQNQNQAATTQADLLWQWIARDFLVGKKGFYSVDALRFWAFDLVDEFLSIHLNSPIPYRPGSYLTLLLFKCLKRGKVL